MTDREYRQQLTIALVRALPPTMATVPEVVIGYAEHINAHVTKIMQTQGYDND